MGYTVELVLGAWSRTIVQGVDQAATDDVVVLDQLRIVWRNATDDHPSPIEPLQASLSLMTRDVDELAALAVDDVALVRVTDTLGAVVASLYGRVTEATATQAKRSLDGVTAIWSTFVVQLVDHRSGVGVPITADLPVQSLASRMFFLHDPAGGPRVSPWPIRLPNSASGADAATYDAANLLEILNAFQAQMLSDIDPAGGTAAPGGLYQLAPIADADTGALELLSWHRVDYAVPTDELPLTLDVDGAVMGLVAAAGAARAVPSERVGMDGSYRRGAENRANVVRCLRHSPRVAGDPVAITAQAEDYADGDRVYMRTAVLDLVQWDTDWIPYVAAALLPPGVRVGGWDRESFGWRPESIDDIGDGWFPDWSDDVYSTNPDYTAGGTVIDELAHACFRAPAAVYGIPDESNFAGAAGVYAGVLTSAELTIHDELCDVTFSIRRQLVRPDTTSTPGSNLTFTELRTRTYAGYRAGAVVVDPGLTHAELRLVRS